MKTKFTFSSTTRRHMHNLLIASVASIAIMLSSTSCSHTGAYWGVDQSYTVGNGSVYYGAYGGDGPHGHYNKKQYKKYLKQQKKLRKQQEKLRKKQQKHNKKHHPKRHRHHDD
ncbi:MAG: hypothetical protein NC402_01200 [Prevotella sp.]|nr:hypothetical protein [Prevotella sp.]MCM1074478.1 hypothetical protein [Ruminococcus sp.]